jgi:uncharacterized protein
MNSLGMTAKPKLYSAGIIFIMLLLFLLSFLGAPAILKLFGLSEINATLYFIERLSYWLALALLWLYVIKIEQERLLIWQGKKYAFLANVRSGFVVIVAVLASTVIIQTISSAAGYNQKSAYMDHMVAIMRNNTPLLVFTALTAGVVEELIFRGYMQPRLEIIFKNPYAAIFISSLFFGLLHYKYGTVTQLVGTAFIGMVFAFFYWKYRNIVVIIVCHFLWDLVSLFVLIKR